MYNFLIAKFNLFKSCYNPIQRVFIYLVYGICLCIKMQISVNKKVVVRPKVILPLNNNLKYYS
ncbi:hypothetical protein Palpr_0043 [Paludibacter propionicigenes WB4]|uniref:Uncharacterized protein n=1 Tax=Paludibacter propionicigenes (strain DSM 17365 / JCM 13257 / WB4) TaxID=694427 RepID=E4T0T0_PALPW|nr:hypothetical protein Palpr_0043 [Paludibacter propionicigenes WB4]